VSGIFWSVPSVTTSRKRFYRRPLNASYRNVIKTAFIPNVEAAGRFLFFIRPRRMGKSLWLSMMEAYYDMAAKDLFEELFNETALQTKITEAKHQLEACRQDPFISEKTKTGDLLMLILVFNGWELVHKEKYIGNQHHGFQGASRRGRPL
jgi:hypothetical protein